MPLLIVTTRSSRNWDISALSGLSGRLTVNRKKLIPPDSIPCRGEGADNHVKMITVTSFSELKFYAIQESINATASEA